MSAQRKPDPFGHLPRAIRPYVRVLGDDLAVTLFLAFGGSAVYLADRPQAGSQLSGVLKPEQIRALAAAIGNDIVRVPTAKPFIACHMRAAGVSVAEIARTLHVADWSVRRWTNADADCKPDRPRLPDLFG